MEKRKYARIPFDIESIVKYQDKTIEGKTLNLSLQGILLNITEQIPLNTVVDVEMNLIGQHSNKTLNVMSRVIRSDNDGTAIKIMKIDIDSFMDLRDIMIQNAGDPDVIMNEFHEFMLQNDTAAN